MPDRTIDQRGPSLERPPSTGLRDDAGFTVTEMLVALLLLTVGALSLYQSMGASTELVEHSDRRITATRLAASEIEQIRSTAYPTVAMALAAANPTFFDGAEQVTDAANGAVTPSSTVERNGLTYRVERYVTWRNSEVAGVTRDRSFKQITVVVSWNDERGAHDVRSTSAVSRSSGS